MTADDTRPDEGPDREALAVQERPGEFVARMDPTTRRHILMADTEDEVDSALSAEAEAARRAQRRVMVIACSMCGGDGDREAESGEFLVSGGCRTCSGRGVVPDWSTLPAPPAPAVPVTAPDDTLRRLIRTLHPSTTLGDGLVCATCRDDEPWPCPTLLALDCPDPSDALAAPPSGETLRANLAALCDEAEADGLRYLHGDVVVTVDEVRRMARLRCSTCTDTFDSPPCCVTPSGGSHTVYGWQGPPDNEVYSDPLRATWLDGYEWALSHLIDPGVLADARRLALARETAEVAREAPAPTVDAPREYHGAPTPPVALPPQPLSDAATPGPWTYQGVTDPWSVRAPDGHEVADAGFPPDAAFIAAAVNYARAALAADHTPPAGDEGGGA